MTMPGWVVTAVTPTDEEVERLRNPLDGALLEACADATTPTSGEVEALVRRLASGPERAHTVGPVFVWAGVAAVAALLLVALLPGSQNRWPEPGAVVALSDRPLRLGPSIELTGRGDVRFGAPGHLDIVEGTVRATVDPTGRDRALTIASGPVSASVVGTVFSVAWDGERAEVAVERGRVRYVSPDEARLLGAGDSAAWPADAGLAAAPPATPMPRLSPVPEPEQAPTVARATTSPATSPITTAPVPPASSAGAPPHPEPEPVAVLAPSDDADPAPDVLPDDVRNFTRIQESIEMNSAPATTLRLTELFLARHPDSELAEEATILRLELLAQAAPPRQALSALDAWISEHPDHAQFLRLLEMRADVARNGLQDCRVALPSYRVLAEKARGSRKARARAFRGLCAVSEGLDDEARIALSDALDDPFLPEALRFEVTESLAYLETQGNVMPLRKAN